MEDSCNKAPDWSNVREKVFISVHGLQGNSSPSERKAQWSSSVVAERCGRDTVQSSVHWEAEMGLEARPSYAVQALPPVTDCAKPAPTTQEFYNLPKWCHQLGSRWSNGRRDTSALNHNSFQCQVSTSRRPPYNWPWVMDPIGSQERHCLTQR